MRMVWCDYYPDGRAIPSIERLCVLCVARNVLAPEVVAEAQASADPPPLYIAKSARSIKQLMPRRAGVTRPGSRRGFRRSLRCNLL